MVERHPAHPDEDGHESPLLGNSATGRGRAVGDAPWSASTRGPLLTGTVVGAVLLPLVTFAAYFPALFGDYI